jgi:hypothetical protein
MYYHHIPYEYVALVGMRVPRPARSADGPVRRPARRGGGRR